ncbi:hypothetical protein ASZ90_018205 [hydrocarbon metagenome]|uniref:Transposase n=1 Tax=hydrocarbon metagenome TaxID=938273 RepID=A0A0W8E7P5_9ZZZZ
MWENDYYQLPIADEEMLIAVQKHIHTNPTRNQLVAEPRLYTFSSYRFYQENERQRFQLMLDQIEVDMD